MHYIRRFGWVFGGCTSSIQGGHFRCGRRIAINAKSTGRQRGAMSRGKEKAFQGRPKGMKLATYTGVHEIPARKTPKGKRQHSLQKSIISGTQNAGKW